MLALTPGEPGGIGIDLVVQICQTDRNVPFVVFTDAGLLGARATELNLPLEVLNFEGRSTQKAKTVSVVHCSMDGSFQPGRLDTANVRGVLSALEQAVDECLGGSFSALVTGPMQKSIVNDAGHLFSGHTEFLAERSGVDDVVMMLANDKMRVALATTHLPLRDVPDAVTDELLQRRMQILVDELKGKFAIREPRIVVAGLNPHAGEGGHLGREEIEVIEPVCENFRDRGIHVKGPLPADTLFTSSILAESDAVFAMYHDQGLPVLKYSGFGEAVNITLGLPFIRTSVDHGTALDIAGTRRADTSSLKCAIEMAWSLSQGLNP